MNLLLPLYSHSAGFSKMLRFSLGITLYCPTLGKGNLGGKGNAIPAAI